jgi:hypothetical protein
MLVVYPYPSAQLGSPLLLTIAFGKGDSHPTLLATAADTGDTFLETY